MNRKDREYLNQLSKEAFGTSSRWQKILLHGVIEKYERNHDVVVPKTDGSAFETKTVKVYENQLRRYTETELTAMMIGLIEKRKEQLAKVFEAQKASFKVTQPIGELPPHLPEGATVTITDSQGNVIHGVTSLTPSVQAI